MSVENNVSLAQFKEFAAVENANVLHDQVHVDSKGTLVSMANTSGAKIQRFFSGVSRSGSAQVSANRQTRDVLLNAIRKELGTDFPDSVKQLLQKSGFDLSSVDGGKHSTKALSSRAIRTIVGEVEKAEIGRLANGRVKNAISSEAAREAVAAIKDSATRSAGLEANDKDTLNLFLGKLGEKAASAEVPTKQAVRTAYALTEMLNAMTKSFEESEIKKEGAKLGTPPEKPPVKPNMPVAPEVPKEPVKKTGLAALLQDYDAELAKYKKDVDEYPAKLKAYEGEKAAYETAMAEYEDEMVVYGPKAKSWADYEAKMVSIKEAAAAKAKEFCRSVFGAAKDQIKDFLKDDGNFDGRIIFNMKTKAEQLSPGIWNKAGQPEMDLIDNRIESCSIAEGKEIAGEFGFEVLEPKSASKNAAATVKVNASEIFSLVKGEIAGLLKGKLAFSGIELKTADDGKSFTLEIANPKLDESLNKMNAASYVNGEKISVPISFGVNARNQRLEVNVGKVSGDAMEKLNDGQKAMWSLVLDLLRTPAELKISKALGTNVTGSQSMNIGYLGKTKSMNAKETAPVEIVKTDKEEVFAVSIDLSKLAPLKAMGFDKDTKFSGCNVEKGSVTLQVGGETDQTKVTKLPPNSTVAMNLDLNGIADRMQHLMSMNDIETDSIRFSTDPQNGKISVEVRNLDLGKLAKKQSFPVSTGMKLMSKGSYRLTFSPSLDAKTGEVTLKIDNIENMRKAHALQGAAVRIGKRVIGKKASVLESVLKDCFKKIPGFDKDAPSVSVAKDPKGGVMTLRVQTASILKLPEGASNLLGGDFKLNALQVGQNGLSVGLRVAPNSKRLVRDSELLQPALNPKPMSPETMKEFKSCIVKSSANTMQQAVKQGGPMGFGGDSLRCGTNGKMFARTTVNGRVYGAGDEYDKSVFEGVEKWGSHSPVLTTTGTPNPNAPFYGHLAALVPKDNPNHDAIMLMVTSQIGLQGLSGDLSSPEIMYDGENNSRDWGFGSMVDLSYAPNKLVCACFGSNPTFAGLRDISLVDNEIVITQRAHFGPQVTSVDNNPVANDEGGAYDVPVCDVTKTIRIPLNQPKVGAGEMPKYTCNVDVAPHIA